METIAQEKTGQGAPLPPLDETQQQWVEQTFASLSLEERVAQLLLPTVEFSPERGEVLLKQLGDIPFGGIFVNSATEAEHRDRLRRFQATSRIPMVVAADLESGAGWVVQGGTVFPDLLALAALDDEEQAYRVGKAAAREGRAAGIHWTFAPVVDVNLNPDNPITNTRSLGDDPDRIIRLAKAIVRGMQEHGLAACPKHFPGDGIDDLDQHIVTSTNSLTREQWMNWSGRIFREIYQAGAWSTMIGHIALPCWDDTTDARGAYAPATVNRRLTHDLLREALGFQGIVVTDDMNMGGVCGYANRRTRTVACIEAGCDMLLFPVLPHDYDVLLEAAQSGELSAVRLNDAVRRILEFKARLNLHISTEGESPDEAEREEYRVAARTIAEKAIVKVRDVNGLLPLRDVKPGARILTVTLSVDGTDVPIVDETLRARGFEVDHLHNPEDWAFTETVKKYEVVFLNFVHKPGWAIGSVRPVGPSNRLFMRGFFMEHPRAIMTSFGSPYHLRMFSTFPNYINMHAACPDSQRAAVAAWFGDIPMNGKSPVYNLTRADAHPTSPLTL